MYSPFGRDSGMGGIAERVGFEENSEKKDRFSGWRDSIVGC
jgi:hypothetical protein